MRRKGGAGPGQAGGRAVTGLGCALLLGAAGAADAAPPQVVAELFTSLGCSSCPPADALAGRLTQVPGVLVLSFHVTYWDGPAWRDPLGLAGATERQYAYSRARGDSTVFTPQLIIDGSRSAVASDPASAVAVESARADLPVRMSLRRVAAGELELTLTGAPAVAELWEIHYRARTRTVVRAGENGGHTLDTYNDVTQIRSLGHAAAAPHAVPEPTLPGEQVAVLAQLPGPGRILGAATYPGE
ncbi:MAG: DUF1223 domain-containing protein [Proteobacteria bacterium]|nr:DUF1223 domain-containing protein [Pseudomonadota bacterium]